MSISPENEASQNNTAKRRDYISWDEYFMGIAMLSAMRSKDPNSQVGACIVRDNKILSLGYNGMPIGCDDDIMPWGREGNELETKYMYVCHSVWNIGDNAPEGYLPFCRLKFMQPFEGGREIDSDTLKAMKCDGAREILAATGLGAETSAEVNNPA